MKKYGINVGARGGQDSVKSGYVVKELKLLDLFISKVLLAEKGTHFDKVWIFLPCYEKTSIYSVIFLSKVSTVSKDSSKKLISHLLISA